MEDKELVKHHTQLIKDQNDNKWEVIETSDLEEIFEAYHQAKLKLLGIADVISRLQSLTKYEASICGGCECCGSWVEHKADEYGDWIKVEDIEVLVKELHVNGL